MSLYKPSGPRPFIDGSNTTVQDLTEHLVRISNRARQADEVQMPGEYEALLNLCLLEQEAMKDFINTVKAERERTRPRRKSYRDVLKEEPQQ